MRRRGRILAVLLGVVCVAALLPAWAVGRPLALRVATTHQREAVRARMLRVVVYAPVGTRVRLILRAQSVTRPGTGVTSAALGLIARPRRVRVGRSGHATVHVRLTAAGVRVLSRCSSVRVYLSARRTATSLRPRRVGARTVTTTRVLLLHARRCHARRIGPASTQTILASGQGFGQGSGLGTGSGQGQDAGQDQGFGPLASPPAPPVGPNGERTLVGVASRSITPPGPEYATHVGGYGDCKGCDKTGTTAVNPGDDLRVRAMVVRRAGRAEVMATADLEGWFAGYKQGAGLGLNDLRNQVAQELSRPVSHGGQGLSMGPQDIIVSSIHCHACATVVGIWGPTNFKYLRFVYAQMRDAIEAAAASARPAALEWATADIGYVNDVLLGQLNANEGWPIDGQLSVLRATDAHTGATIGTYANVPAHGNIVHGPDSHAMSSEYFGAADRRLESHLGGVGVVGPGTLGDQTTPMQGTAAAQALAVDARLGALVGATVLHALATSAHPITDPTLGGAETYLIVPFTNPALAGSDCLSPVTAVVGIQIDRSCDPPYAVASTGLGSWFTTLRIGTIAIASQPGEAFPHVTFAMRRVLSGAQAVFTPGQAQDQLGYYYEPFAFPTTFVYSADHNIFHASMFLAEANTQAQIPNGTKLGFAVTPSASDPTGNDFTRIQHPGVQVFAYPRPQGAAAAGGLSVPIGVYRAPARCQSANPLPTPACSASADPGPATVDFGDGSPLARAASPPGGPFACCIDLRHTFPHPGAYDVRATLPTGESWTSTVHVQTPFLLYNQAHYPVAGTVLPSPGQSGR